MVGLEWELADGEGAVLERAAEEMTRPPHLRYAEDCRKRY